MGDFLEGKSCQNAEVLEKIDIGKFAQKRSWFVFIKNNKRT